MMTRSRHWLSLVAIWLLPGLSERTWRRRRRRCSEGQEAAVFRATIGATEEAVVNAMLAAPAVSTGVDGIHIFGLPGPRLVEVLKKYGRMR